DFFHAQAPLSPYLLAFVFLMFGVGILQARLFLVFFTTFTCFMIFMAGKRIDYKTGLLGSLIFAITPLSVKYGMNAVNDFIAMTFCAIGYYFLTSVIMINENKKNLTAERNNSILAGLFMSIGVMIKLIVAPILFAFIVILIIEGIFFEFEIKNQVKKIFFLIVGFVIPFLVVFSSFYLLFGDNFTAQVLGQHLAKKPVSYGERWNKLMSRLIIVNPYFFVLFSLSVLFAARQPYGRGLIICFLCMILAVFTFVPSQNTNYYQINILFMSMVCGFFPLPDFKALNFKSLIPNFIVILNLLLYKIYRYSNSNVAGFAYFEHYLAKVALAATLITLIAFIVILTKEKQITELKISDRAKKLLSSPYQVLKGLKNVLNKDVTKLVLASALIVIIATTGVSYPSLSESDKKTIEWIKANTSPDDYVLADDLKINFRAKRRSPFAEISTPRTRFGELTGEMFIEACYEFDIRVVVKTRRLFDSFDTYDVFLEFLEINYVPIKEGHIIYVRTTPLK
ncbi:glycosyltransferase family 39 protein, partial [Candidatus Borrarchaeum sp.]|uniref:glycosyltransferase family 39 protein n=1 Tax=Candidatus Borrarchaeum sp. TaxID=2846742 RepID=UPI00257BA43E